MDYAFEEFRNLGTTLDQSNPDPILVRYLSALVSELAYHHIPEFEIDHQKRAKLVPCDGYRQLRNKQEPMDVKQFLEEMDFEESFVVEDRGIIAVGILLETKLFVGFRGTCFLFDWMINFKSSMVAVVSPMGDSHGFPFLAAGKYHRGFAEEAVRMKVRISDALKKGNFRNVDRVFFSGHSLGGAVAAICQGFFGMWPRTTSTCMFGSPRYADSMAYSSAFSEPATQIQRPGDIVPFVPPKRFGYADHPWAFDTLGNPVKGKIRASGMSHLIWCACLFSGKRFAPHDIESYRKELGRAANASYCEKELVPCRRLARSDVSA